MTESVAPPRSKWLKDASPDQPTHKIARRFLERRLLSFAYWVARAAEGGDHNADSMSRLVASSDRAIEVIRAFSIFIDIENWDFLRERLGEIRTAAKEAYDIEAIGQPFQRSVLEGAVDDSVHKVADIVSEQHQKARLQISSLHNQLAADQFGEVIRATVDSVNAAKKGKAKLFGDYARRYFSPLLKDFLMSIEDDLSEEETFHDVCIQAKRIRNSMEIVEVAFRPKFRRKLYPRITSLWQMMEQVKNHTTARILYREWMSPDDDEQLNAFLQGVTIAAEKADADIHNALLSVWTKAEFSRLKKQFKKCSKD